MKSKRKRKQLLPITLILILCVSIGYAFLSSAINLKGQASIKGNNFDVHFENIKVSADSVEVSEEDAAKITNPTEVKFKAALNAPGDKYEFTVDVVNSGTVDAMIGDLDDIVLTPKQQKVLDYSITYKDGQPVNPLDGIKASDKLPIKVAVNYKTEVTAEDIQNVDEEPVAVTQAVNYIQADERTNFIEITPPPTMLNIGYYYNDRTLSGLKTYYPNLATVTLSDSINVPEGAPNWDISEAGNSSVMAYVVPNETDSTKYDLHIEGEGGISAPVDSSFLFYLSKSQYGDPNKFTSISGLDLLNTSQVTNMHSMFQGCSSSTSLDLSNFDTSNVTDMGSMFNGCSGLTTLDLSSLDTSNVTDMSSMFRMCSSLTSLNLSPLITTNVTSMLGMFQYCSSLKDLNLSSFNTNSLTKVSSMFEGCSNLTGLNLGNLNTSNATYMYSMFRGCSKLTSLDVSNLDTSKATDMLCMFEKCSSLTSLDISNFDTSNVTNISSIFKECSSLINLNLSNFDTSSATYMDSIFYGCSSLTSLDLSNFDTSQAKNMSSMFNGCSSLTNLDLSNFDTSKATNMSSMFWECSSLTSLDLSNFDTSNVTNMEKMFVYCSKLKNLDFRNANFDKVTSYGTMFVQVANGINIIVKDEAAKTWMIERNKYNSNVVVKTVAEL